jgi:hypothetical protein
MTDRFHLMETSMKSELAILKELVVSGGNKQTTETEAYRESGICRKKSCKNLVAGRFANGKKKKQCSVCNIMAHRTHKKCKTS